MWLVIAAIAIVVAWAYFANRKPSRASTGCRAPEREVKFEVSIWKHDDCPTGKRVTLSKSVALTLTGAGAGEVVNYLAGTANRQQESGLEAARRRSFELALLMARLNVDCPEVETWRVALLKKVDAETRRELGVTDTATADGDDEDDLKYAMAEHGTELLHESGVPYWIDYEEFAQPRPADTTADDEMLARLSSQSQTLGDLAFYMVHAGSLIQSHQDRSHEGLSRLVAAGYALPGREAPLAELVSRFTVAQLREAIGGAGKFRKKVDASPFLTPDVVAKLPGLERLFYIKPLSAEDMTAMSAFRWMQVHAELIQVTFRCAEKVAITAALNRAQRDKSYMITGDCCSKSRRNRDATSRLPVNLPPYHIGCTACIEVY